MGAKGQEQKAASDRHDLQQSGRGRGKGRAGEASGSHILSEAPAGTRGTRWCWTIVSRQPPPFLSQKSKLLPPTFSSMCSARCLPPSTAAPCSTMVGVIGTCQCECERRLSDWDAPQCPEHTNNNHAPLPKLPHKAAAAAAPSRSTACAACQKAHRAHGVPQDPSQRHAHHVRRRRQACAAGGSRASASFSIASSQAHKSLQDRWHGCQVPTMKNTKANFQARIKAGDAMHR